MEKQEENQMLNDKTKIRKFRLVNLQEGQKHLCFLCGVIVGLLSFIKQDLDYLLIAVIVLIAVIGCLSIKNNYLESKIEGSFNLIVSILASKEKLSSKELKDSLCSIPLKDNKDFLLLKWKYHKMMVILLDLGYINLETEWPQQQFYHFYMLTEKGLALAKRQQNVEE